MSLSIRSFLPHSGNIFIYCYPERKKGDFCPNKKSPKHENLALWLDLTFANAYKFMEAKFNKGAMTMGLNMSQSNKGAMTWVQKIYVSHKGAVTTDLGSKK